MEHEIRKSLSRRERVARASGPGEGYLEYFLNIFSFLYPSPAASRHPLPSGEGIAPKLFPIRTSPRHLPRPQLTSGKSCRIVFATLQQFQIQQQGTPASVEGDVVLFGSNEPIPMTLVELRRVQTISSVGGLPAGLPPGLDITGFVARPQPQPPLTTMTNGAGHFEYSRMACGW